MIDDYWFMIMVHDYDYVHGDDDGWFDDVPVTMKNSV